MKRKSTRVKFANSRGQQLVGILEQPTETIRHYALFAHCFTCGKDLKAMVRLSRKLTEFGFAVLRFDFTGLYDSEGEFSESNLTTNIADIHSAIQFLSEDYSPPSLLIGHSLGGTAMTLAAKEIGSAKALVTIASPSSTARLAGFLEASNPEIVSEGLGEVVIGGFSFLMKQQLMHDLRSHNVELALENLRIPILMYHSPADQTLPYEWGLKMFEACKGVKSFITLDGSDHLLVDQPGDIEFVAATTYAWAKRYLG